MNHDRHAPERTALALVGYLVDVVGATAAAHRPEVQHVVHGSRQHAHPRLTHIVGHESCDRNPLAELAEAYFSMTLVILLKDAENGSGRYQINL